MDEKGLTGSNGLYPMLFGVSCALFALKHSLSNEIEYQKQIEITDKMLQGGASLMGLLLWRGQREKVKAEKSKLFLKLTDAKTEIEELKKRRVEDAKANEKVVGIFAAHEQGWFMERKKLRQQIGALLNELRVSNTKNEENVAKLNSQLQEKDKFLEEERHKMTNQQETVRKAEKDNQELREMLEVKGQDHSKELWKHKSAFIELVSTQRQLEAEMGRAVRQVEAAKQELDAVLEQKEEYVMMTQKLSMKLIKTRKDLEQKDNILSAMLRKSKLDTSEKQMLLKEIKLSKSKRQKAELETEKLRNKTVNESRQERHSLRSMLSRHHKSKPESFSNDVSSFAANVLKYEKSEFKREQEVPSPISQQSVTESSQDLMDIRQLEGWVESEAEKYVSAIEQRHQLEMNAFAEQLRLKDEKLEAFQWRSLRMDLESKQLHTHIEGLDHDLTQLKEETIKLEALLLDRESELHTLKERLESELQLRIPKSQKDYSNSPSNPLAITQDNTIWSNVTIVKRKPGEKDKGNGQEDEKELKNQSKDIALTVQSPDKEFESKKDVTFDLISVNGEEVFTKKDALNGENISSSWKMDLHALGVFYKIKRLEQQLLMFERLRGKQESCEKGECDDKKRSGVEGFYRVMSLVNKQVSRYQSLQGKADDICKRLHENNLDASRRNPDVAKSKDETKRLELFLEETFQLQRYIVATGQKMMEIQSKIACGFVAASDDRGAASFDMKKFADCLRTLFREVQRGLEVRISRIIGDLEGPLARDGMIYPRTSSFLEKVQV